MRECPCCGTVAPPKTGVTVGEGDLSEFGRRTPGGPLTVRDQIAAQGKRAVYMQLLGFAEERNRSMGWAAHTYRDVFGTWPNGLSKHLSAEPTPLVRSWLRSRDIAFAKGMNGRKETSHAA